jgi:imidazolonepropionase-like amidohydrolase
MGRVFWNASTASATLVTRLMSPSLSSTPSLRDRARDCARGVALPNLKKLEDGGVTIAAGTDAGNIGTIHGPALFREFQLMKEARLTPMQILQCATANAAKLFGGETGAHVGKLENGCLADLVILNSNPLDDIVHTSDIDTVMKNGVAYPADSILH